MPLVENKKCRRGGLNIRVSGIFILLKSRLVGMLSCKVRCVNLAALRRSAVPLYRSRLIILHDTVLFLRYNNLCFFLLFLYIFKFYLVLGLTFNFLILIDPDLLMN